MYRSCFDSHDEVVLGDHAARECDAHSGTYVATLYDVILVRQPYPD